MYTSGFWYYGIYHGVLRSPHGFHDFLIWGHIILAEQLGSILDFYFLCFFYLFIYLLIISFIWLFCLLAFFSIPTHGTLVYYGICSS